MIIYLDKIQKLIIKLIQQMKIKYALLTMGLLFGLASCEMRDELKGDLDKLDPNQGLMELDLSAKSDYPTIEIRSFFPEEDVNISNYTIKILDAATEEIKKECTYSELMQGDGKVKLAAGKYKVIAYNYDGSEVAASERPFFQGQADFQILPGKLTSVSTTCRLQNFGVVISLTDKFLSEFKDTYAITVTNGVNGVYIFTKDNINKKIYFSVPQNTSSISMSVKGTTKGNVEIAQSYTITKPVNAENSSELLPGDFLKININPGDEPSVDPVTKVKLNISVDLTMSETGVTIEIPTENITENPGGGTDIKVEGLNKTYILSKNMDEPVPPIIVSLSVPNGIQKLLVKIDSDNEAFMETLAGFGLVEEFDLANPGDLIGVLSGSIEDLEGIGLIDENDPIKGKTSYVFDITDFMGLLKLYGLSKNTFTITVSDGVNEDVKGVLQINIVDTTK